MCVWGGGGGGGGEEKEDMNIKAAIFHRQGTLSRPLLQNRIVS